MTRILYIEDHPIQRDVLAQIMELNGYEVVVAEDGLTGIDKIRSWLPDLILTDLKMPRMDGHELIKMVRSDARLAAIPIIAISGVGTKRYQERALAAGANEFFNKPVDLNDLLTTIDRYFKASRDEREAEKTNGFTPLRRVAEEETPFAAQQMEIQLGRAFIATKHDLAGMLGIILQDTERMLTVPPTPERLKRVWRSTRHAVLLLQSVGDLRPGGVLNLENASLVDLIEESLALVEPHLRGRTKIERRYMPKVPGVKVDSLRFQQVLVNLFKNAREAEADTLRITINQSYQGLHLRISDNGEGFSHSDPNQLFELWKSTKPGGDRGIGLYIVKTITERHDWSIELKSTPGQGAHFFITIPPHSLIEPVASKHRFSGSEIVASLKPRLLVVDDNADTLDLLKDSLQAPDYALDTSGTMPDALNKVTGQDYDVIVTDLRFLGEDEANQLAGMRLLTAAREVIPPIQVVIVTGFGSEEIGQSVIQYGAFDYITKPINFDQLRLSILKAIEARQNTTVKDEVSIAETHLVGNSPAMKGVIEQIHLAAKSQQTVFIYGEAGVGKSFVAENIHFLSRQSKANFFDADCRSLTEKSLRALIKKVWHDNSPGRGSDRISEDRHRVPKSTILLNSVEDLQNDAQQTLLGLLKHLKRQSPGDLRFIATSNSLKNSRLQPALRRQLSGIEIHVPSLQERPDDIPLLIGHFLRKYTFAYGFQIQMSKEAADLLRNYSYPDNIVELENAIKFSIRKAKQGFIQPIHLPQKIRKVAVLDAYLIRQKSLKKQVTQYQSHLDALQKRRANYSAKAPRSLLDEIALFEKEIKRLSAALNQLKSPQ